MTKGVGVYLASLGEAAGLKAFVALLASWCAWLYPIGAERSALLVALVMVLADWVTGILATIKAGKAITSARARDGLLKVAVYVVIALAFAVWARLDDTGLGRIVLTGILAIVGLTEAFSVLENASKAGLRVPKWARTLLKDKIDDLDSGETHA